MKKITLLVATILLVGNVAKASEMHFTDDRTRFSFDEPIAFNERGIEFFVFPNGDFDFNTRPDDSQGDYFFRGAGKKGSNEVANRGGHPVNYGTLIEHDSFGRVRRVGNTFINYDAFDRVSRIGTVYMRYNRFALTQIGGMRITYNRFGEIIAMMGEVKGRRSGFTTNHYLPTNSGYAYNTTTHNYYYKGESREEKEEDKR